MCVWRWCVCVVVGAEGLASSMQHRQGDGLSSLLGPVSMGKEQRTVCDGSLIVEVGFESK